MNKKVTKSFEGALAKRFSLVLAGLLVVFLPMRLPAAQMQRLAGHVPAVVARLQAAGDLPPTNILRLAIGLPVRNPVQLTNLLAGIYDRSSTNFHHYLTPAQFADRFGPNPADYQSVLDFARTNGLTVTRIHSNRMLVDVAGSVDAIERTFNLKLRIYHHPAEARDFYAPDVEPSLNLSVPILHISGLDNYVLPHPMDLRKTSGSTPKQGRPYIGSGPEGSYWGNDFRQAYIPGTVMTGIGQTVGLFQQSSGFYQSDIAAYENAAGLPNVSVTPVLLDGYDGGPGDANDECSLDIEMAIAMAPGLSQILVYEGSVPDDILNQMATDDSAQQLSSSWSFAVDATTEQIFQQFGVQGQSFFNAAGDNGAWVGGVASPSDDPNISIVGGTTLTTTNGVWQAEKVWSWTNGYASGGGISTAYSIPAWQQGVDMTLNQGSTTMRNIPDVALTADNIFVVYGNGTNGVYGGTSCASPLWAGFTALINQQAANNGVSPVGFINPAIYTLCESTNYTETFHDITVGNNTNSTSDDLFFAVPGYDLCTGWGTPNGQSLLNALVGAPNPTPAYIITQPASQTVYAGSTVTFSVAAGGLPPFFYQWQLDGTNIVDATNAIFTLTGVETDQSGDYSVIVTNAFGSTASSSAALIVNEPLGCDPVPPDLVSWWPGDGNAVDVMGLNNGVLEGGIGFTNGEVGAGFWYFTPTADVRIPASSSLNVGTSGGFTLEAWVNCTSLSELNPVFEWNKGDGTTPEGVHFYVWTDGSLYANIVDTGGSVLPGHIIQSPPGLINPGTFNHIALTYDYSSGMATLYCNGTPVEQSNLGQFTPLTSYDLYLGRRPPTDGATYSFVGVLDEPSLYNRALTPDEILAIYNAGSGGKCGPAAPPFIITQPTNETVNLGQTASFSVVAGGSEPLFFQWIFNGTNNIPGGTNATLTLVQARLNQAGNYSVLVTNTAGSKLSSSAILTVNPPPPCAPVPSGIISWWPAEQSALDVIGTNSGVLEGDVGFTNGIDGDGFWFVDPNSDVRIPASSSLDVGNGNGFTLEAWINCANVTQLNPIFEWNTGDGTTVEGVHMYVWSDGSLYGNVMDTNGNPLAHNFQSVGGLITSNIFYHVALTFDKNIGVETLYLNGVQVAQNSTGPISPETSYDLYLGRRPLTQGETYSFSGILDEPAIYNRPLGSNELRAIYLAESSGKCFSSPVMIVQPTNETVYAGTSNSFTAIADGSAIMNYQWNFKGTNLPGATNSTLSLTNIEISQGGIYAVLATNAFGSVLSSNALLKVLGLPPTIVSQPTNQTVVMGGSATFAVVAGGTPPFMYQWLFNATNKLAGATNATLTLTNTMASQAGYYSILVTNAWGQTNSSSATLSFFVPPVITAQPTNVNAKVGAAAAFTVAATGSAPLRYQWYWNATNNPLSGATNATYAIAVVQATNAGTYSVLVTNVAGAVLSSNAVLSVHFQDHFAWGTLPSPRFVNTPFTATIQAQNTTNGLVTNFTGTVNLTSTLGIPVHPPLSAPFVHGSWTGSVMLAQAVTNLVLQADDGLGDTGRANVISVLNPPTLGFGQFGGSLLIYWPTNVPGFEVESAHVLNSSNWLPVTGQPLSAGGLNIETFPFTGSNTFYRLLYTVP